MAEIVTNKSDISAKPSEKKIQVRERKDIFLEYHDSEIKQNENIIRNAIRMIWVGIVIIILASLNAMIKNTNTALIVGISGVFIDFYAATIIQLANKSSDNKQKNLESLSVLEHEKRIIEFVRETDCNNEFQCNMVTKIVENHCANR